ncbi:MAG: hypothetical protein ACK2T7_11090, partial [Anaerolineales bacterium]
MALLQKAVSLNTLLEEQRIAETLRGGLEDVYTGQKVLVLVPDHTRSLPLPQLFRLLVDVLSDTRRLDF